MDMDVSQSFRNSAEPWKIQPLVWRKVWMPLHLSSSRRGGGDKNNTSEGCENNMWHIMRPPEI